jgi:SAM-dependent methyltransferase
MAESNIKPSGAAGAAVYGRIMLFFYDLWVLGISGPYAFGCSTRKVLLPFFRQHFSKNHLDIGVGTGYYLKNTKPIPGGKTTLVDLNQNSLDTANQRIGWTAANSILHDISDPLPIDDKFDSISMFYLIHCLPSPVERKMEIFAHLKKNLSPTGTIYGASALGQGVKYGWFGRFVWSTLLKEGIMDNKDDNEEAFAKALNENFEQVQIRIEGTILLFTASIPKVDDSGLRRRHVDEA